VASSVLPSRPQTVNDPVVPQRCWPSERRQERRSTTWWAGLSRPGAAWSLQRCASVPTSLGERPPNSGSPRASTCLVGGVGRCGDSPRDVVRDEVESRVTLLPQLDLSANLLGCDLRDEVLATVPPQSLVPIAMVGLGVSNLVAKREELLEVAVQCVVGRRVRPLRDALLEETQQISLPVPTQTRDMLLLQKDAAPEGSRCRQGRRRSCLRSSYPTSTPPRSRDNQDADARGRETLKARAG
jgi:hypothetical protein